MKFDFDLTSWAGISAAALVVVSILKISIRKVIDGREEVTSIIVGAALGVAALLSHTMTFQPGLHGWIQAVLGGVSAGLAAGVAHDKGWNPLVKMFSREKKTEGEKDGPK